MSVELLPSYDGSGVYFSQSLALRRHLDGTAPFAAFVQETLSNVDLKFIVNGTTVYNQGVALTVLSTPKNEQMRRECEEIRVVIDGTVNAILKKRRISYRQADLQD